MFFGAITMVHYCKKLMGVVVFAKVQGQVKFESLRTRHFSARTYFLDTRIILILRKERFDYCVKCLIS